MMGMTRFGASVLIDQNGPRKGRPQDDWVGANPVITSPKTATPDQD